jgi:DNA gyrase/topoisomerase IV subunit A
MRLRALTNLDTEELLGEEKDLEALRLNLTRLVEDPKSRSTWLMKQMDDMAKRHGEARKSPLIDPPDPAPVVEGKGPSRPSQASLKPRFLKVDVKKGTVTQEKGPRGAMVVDRAEKVVLMTQDGFMRKVPSNFKGPISEGYSAVALAKRESEVAERSYLAVFVLEGQLKAVVVSGEDLCRANSKGKRWLPEGAEFEYFGEGSYVVPWASPRKKRVELRLAEVRQGRPGAKGQKVANVDEVNLALSAG